MEDLVKEMRDLLWQFREEEDNDIATGKLNFIFNKLYECVKGSVAYKDLKVGEYFIEIPKNILECCRLPTESITGESILYKKIGDGTPTEEHRRLPKSAERIKTGQRRVIFPDHLVLRIEYPDQ